MSLKRSLAIFGVLLAALPAVAGANPIVNPSFELGLTGWTVDTVGWFGVNAEASQLNDLPTDGVWAGRIYSMSDHMFAAGDFGSLSQVVDLTDVTSIVFDATLDRARGGLPQGAWSRTFEAAFLGLNKYIHLREVGQRIRRCECGRGTGWRQCHRTWHCNATYGHSERVRGQRVRIDRFTELDSNCR